MVIAKQTEMSEHTAVDWSSFCREVVYDLMVTKSEQLGGEGIEVSTNYNLN